MTFGTKIKPKLKLNFLALLYALINRTENRCDFYFQGKIHDYLTIKFMQDVIGDRFTEIKMSAYEIQLKLYKTLL